MYSNSKCFVLKNGDFQSHRISHVIFHVIQNPKASRFEAFVMFRFKQTKKICRSKKGAFGSGNNIMNSQEMWVQSSLVNVKNEIRNRHGEGHPFKYCFVNVGKSRTNLKPLKMVEKQIEMFN